MCGSNYSPDVRRNFSPLDSGGGADDWAIHWLIRTDGEVNKLHTQVIAGFLLGYRGEWRMMMRERVCVCVAGCKAVELDGVHLFSICTLTYLLNVPQSCLYCTQLAKC